ncbi:MAG: DegT/DnrJ/EryC1/StrS family aminotransferase, partial [Deltaproteobacteria bacterium]|nr:DegT/DnrJ/EryC1/StrS family aminotransferase [Deltaproteobacteria bacterium]
MNLIKESQIPFVNFTAQVGETKKELLEAVSRVLEGGNYILGPEVAAFEKEFAAFCGSRFAIGVSNGTSALILALRALDVGHGDEVITVSNTFISTVSSIVLVGATPVFVDIQEDLNIDPTKIEAAITPKTKAIIPVHLTGRPADMEKICAIAKKHNLFVIEDAAQAVGAALGKRKVGTFGILGCFSLHPLKNLNAYGDAGIITTDDETLAAKLRTMRNLGLIGRNDCEMWSGNERLDELQAALLRVNFRHLPKWTEEKQSLASYYDKELAAFAKIPLRTPAITPVYQLYMVRVQQRDALLAFLQQNGIDAKVHYPSLVHTQEITKKIQPKNFYLPETEKAATEIISLPLFVGMKKEQQERVVEV